MAQLTAKWTKLLSTERLRRSSQVLSVIDQTVYIFGGEVQPRQPVDNKIDTFSLQPNTPNPATVSPADGPISRVGSASAVANGKMYLFSGRGGLDMAPIEENGALWCYDPLQASWHQVKPAEPSRPYPPARSYHTLASDGRNTIFLHAGCPAKGRLSDMWKFDIPTLSWTQAPDAPAPARGGTSIAYLGSKIYRMNGFDGTKEQGGNLDVFDVASSSWSSLDFKADNVSGPEPRSVCALLPLDIKGKPALITLFGERDPSSLGHAGAGKMLSDVWSYDIESGSWSQVAASGSGEVPDPRGWFDADVIKSYSSDGILVHGGLAENNERLTDVWLLSF